MSYMCYVVRRQFYSCLNCNTEMERFVGFVRESESLLGLGWVDRLSVDTGPVSCPLCMGNPVRESTKAKILHGVLAVAGEEPVDSER